MGFFKVTYCINAHSRSSTQLKISNNNYPAFVQNPNTSVHAGRGPSPLFVAHLRCQSGVGLAPDLQFALHRVDVLVHEVHELAERVDHARALLHRQPQPRHLLPHRLAVPLAPALPLLPKAPTPHTQANCAKFYANHLCEQG